MLFGLFCLSSGKAGIKDISSDIEAKLITIDTKDESIWSSAQQGAGSDALLLGKTVGSDGFSIITTTDASGEITTYLESQDDILALAQTNDGTIKLLCETDDGAWSVCGMSAAGAVLQSNELLMQRENVRRVVGMCCDSAGSAYICWDLADGKTAVTVLSPTLDALYTIECSGECFGFAMSGNVPYCLFSGGRLKSVNTEKEAWGESIKTEIDIVGIFLLQRLCWQG